MRNVFFLFFLMPALVFSQGWEKSYGRGVGYSVQQTTDGGYVVIASDNIFLDIYLVKTDGNGDTLWTKTYGENEQFFAFGGCQTSDGGYIMTGWADEDNVLSDLLLIKTDSNGDMLWTKTFGGDGREVGFAVQQTIDGGYIVTGWTDSFSGSHDVYLIKTDGDGNALWSKTYGDDLMDTGKSVQQTSDVGFIIAGESSIMGSGYSSVYLIKTDDNGDFLWSKTYGGDDEDAARSVQQTTDGGYIVTGYTETINGPTDVCLIKTDASGDTLWTKTFGGSEDDNGSSVRQTADGGYIIIGFTTAYNNSNDVYLIKTNEEGSLLWSKTYGSIDNDGGIAVQQTTDGGYILTGVYADDYIYLIKTDEDGIVLSTTEIPLPNPNRKLVKMVDISGKEIRKPQKNIPYIEIYDDGTTQKKMIR